MAPKPEQQNFSPGDRDGDVVVSGSEDEFVSFAPGQAATPARGQRTKTKTKTKPKPQKSANVDSYPDEEEEEHNDAYQKTRNEMRRLLSFDTNPQKLGGGDGKREVKKTRKVAATEARLEKEEAPRTRNSKRTRTTEDAEDVEENEPVPTKKVKETAKAAVPEVEEEDEEDEEIVVNSQKTRKGVATKVNRVQRTERVAFDLPTSGTSDVELSPPTTTARSRKPTTTKSVSRTGSPAPRARPSTAKATQRRTSTITASAPARSGPPADRFQPSANKFTNVKGKNIHDIRNAPQLPEMNRSGRTANTFEARTTKGLGTVVSRTISDDGNHARMEVGTLPNMAGLGDAEEMMRRVQEASDRAKGISGMAPPPSKKRKR